MLAPRTYKTIPLFNITGYRRWSRPWWKVVLDPQHYWDNLYAFWQRGRRGWADRDCWSLDYYLAGWMGDALHHLHTESYGLWERSKEGERAYLRMIEAFDAAAHVHWECECWKNLSTDELLKHDKQYERHWHMNAPMFVENFFRLWW